MLIRLALAILKTRTRKNLCLSTSIRPLQQNGLPNNVHSFQIFQRSLLELVPAESSVPFPVFQFRCWSDQVLCSHSSSSMYTCGPRMFLMVSPDCVSLFESSVASLSFVAEGRFLESLITHSSQSRVPCYRYEADHGINDA